MTEEVDAATVRGWIDDDLVTDVEQLPDEAAAFNLVVDLSNILVHVIRRDPGGPLLIGQQIEYDEGIRDQLQALPPDRRADLLGRVRETLTATPGVYGFQDLRGNNVRFEELSRVFLEHRIYPVAIDQQAVMAGLVGVWKALRYLDDLPTLIDAYEH